MTGISTWWPRRGEEVKVVAGRYRGRRGTVETFDLIQSGQSHLYPVVRLAAEGRVKERTHRFVIGSLAPVWWQP